MIVHADKNPAPEHVRRYNKINSSGIPAIVSGAEEDELSSRVLRPRRCATVLPTKNNSLYIIPIFYMSNDSLSYFLILSYGENDCHFWIVLSIGKAIEGEKERVARTASMLYRSY